MAAGPTTTAVRIGAAFDTTFNERITHLVDCTVTRACARCEGHANVVLALAIRAAIGCGEAADAQMALHVAQEVARAAILV